MSSNRRAARAAAVLGALAVLAIPAGVAVSKLWGKVTLLQSLWVTVPLAAVLGLVAVSAARRARYAAAQSIRPDAAAGLRLARFLAWAGVYAAVTGAIALAVYAGLRLAE
jgi:hypothetical protein